MHTPPPLVHGRSTNPKTFTPAIPTRLAAVGAFALALGLLTACTPTPTPPGDPLVTPGGAAEANPGDSGTDPSVATSAYPPPDTGESGTSALASGVSGRLVLPHVDNLGTFDSAALPGTIPPLAAAPPTALPPVAADPGCPGIAVRDGDKLVVDGQPFVFFGLNAHSLLDEEFPEERVEPIVQALSERGVNTLRVWYFRNHDPERFERLLDIGARHGVRFVVTLEDNVFKGVDWFFGDTDEEKYRPHVRQTVERFKTRPEILLWEPINEPNCGDGRYDDECLKTLRDWLKMMAREIKTIDACHVVSTAMIGDGNFESEEKNYRNIHGSDAIEILSVHKRSVDDRVGELEAADDKERPIFYGEIYDEAYDEGCNVLDGDQSPRVRAERIKDDLRQAIEDGVDGYLLWDFSAGLIGDKDYCSKFGYYVDDPLWDKLQSGGDLPPPVPWR
jgi:hypothetical protein